MLTLNYNDENTIQFNMAISGVDFYKAPEIRFVICNGPMNLYFNAKKENGDLYSVIIPNLTSVIDEGQYESRFEIVINDKIHIPYKQDIIFQKSAPDIKFNIIKPTNVPAILSKEFNTVNKCTTEPINADAGDKKEIEPKIEPILFKDLSLLKDINKEIKDKISDFLNTGTSIQNEKPIVDLTIKENKKVKFKKTSTILIQEDSNIKNTEHIHSDVALDPPKPKTPKLVIKKK